MDTMTRDYGRSESGGTGGWTIVEGILLIVIGLIAIGAPLVTAGITALLLPIVLLVKGITELVSAFRGHSVGRPVWSIVLGIVTIIAALVLFADPALAFITLPAILIAYLIVDGIVRIIAGVSAPEGSGRGWLIFAGVISLGLAALLWAQPLGATLVLTGIYIGVNILVAGILLLALGMSERRHAPGKVSPV